MKIRTKITFITIITIVIFVLISNIAFEKFFSNYLENQEEAQIDSIRLSIETFLNERKNKYQGNVNDWSHWDDTYNFMNNNYPNYINEHVIEDSFINLGVNFIIISDENNTIKAKQFYDFKNKKFIEFPKDINDDMKKIITYSNSKKDSSDILKLGDEFYFVASSEVTDSLMKEKPNGKMFFGRLIDKNMSLLKIIQ